MAGDSLVLGAALVQHVRNIAVGCTVITQTLHAVFLIPFVRYTVNLTFQWDIPMKGCLETADEQCFRQKASHNSDSIQICPVMQRRKAQPILHSFKHLGIQFMNTKVPFGESCLIPHPLDFGYGSDHAHWFSCQIFEKQTYTAFVIGDIRFIKSGFLPCQQIHIAENRIMIGPHPLHTALGKHPSFRHVIKFEFERCASHIANENYHQ